jgi:hypothetical protein
LAQCDPPLAAIGYRADAAGQVVRRNYGHNFEKTILLSALLSSQGIANRVAFFADMTQPAPDVPALSSFGKAVVVLPTSSGDHLLNTDAVQSRYGEVENSGRHLFDFMRNNEAPQVLSDSKKAHPLLKVNAEVRLDKDLGLSGNAVIACSGYWLPYLDVLAQEGQKKLACRILSQTFMKCEVEKVAVMQLAPDLIVFAADFKVVAALNKLGEDALYQAIWNNTFSEWHYTPYMLQRTTPLLLPAETDEEIDVRIICPEEYHLAKPISASRHNAAGALSISCKEQDGRIELRQVLKLAKRIAPADYPDFRELVILLQAAENRTLWIAKN